VNHRTNTEEGPVTSRAKVKGDAYKATKRSVCATCLTWVETKHGGGATKNKDRIGGREERWKATNKQIHKNEDVKEAPKP